MEEEKEETTAAMANQPKSELLTVIEQLKASLEPMESGGFPLIDAKVMVRALALTLQSIEANERDLEPELTGRVGTLEKTIKNMAYNIQGFSEPERDESEPEKPAIDPFEYTRQVQERMDAMEAALREKREQESPSPQPSPQPPPEPEKVSVARRRAEKAARRKLARERWHRAFKMVGRAVRVKRISGGMAVAHVEKGQSLAERLSAIEANTKKNTSSIQRIEGQVEAMMNAIQNLAQNLTGVDEKVDLHHEQSHDVLSEETASMAYAAEVQDRIESPEARAARLAAEAKDKHLKYKHLWHRAFKVVARSNHVRMAANTALGRHAGKGESMAEKLRWLERFILAREARDMQRLGQLELSLLNLAKNIQGFDSKLATYKEEEAARNLGGDYPGGDDASLSRVEEDDQRTQGEEEKEDTTEGQFRAKNSESEGDVAAGCGGDNRAQRKRAKARRRWKKAIRLTIWSMRFQKQRGLLTSGTVHSKSVMERLKQVEKDLSKMLVQHAAPDSAVVEFVEKGHDGDMHRSPTGFRPHSPDSVPNRTKKALDAFYNQVEGPAVHDLASRENREALVKFMEIKSAQDKLTGQFPSLFEVANMNKLQCKILADQIARLQKEMSDANEKLESGLRQAQRHAAAAAANKAAPVVVNKVHTHVHSAPAEAAAPPVIEGEFATFEEMTSELARRDEELKNLLALKADRNEVMDMVARKADSDQMNPIRSKLGDLEDQFLAFTREQESTLGRLVSDLIEAYLSQLNLPSSDSMANKQEVDDALAKLAAMMKDLYDGKTADDEHLQELLRGKADKEAVESKADLSMLEAIKDLFKGRMDELAELAAGGATPQDLEKLRKKMEEDLKRAMADLLKQKEDDSDVVATVRCLTCGQNTNEQNPVVGAYAANKSKLRPHRLGDPAAMANLSATQQHHHGQQQQQPNFSATMPYLPATGQFGGGSGGGGNDAVVGGGFHIPQSLYANSSRPTTPGVVMAGSRGGKIGAWGPAVPQIRSVQQLGSQSVPQTRATTPVIPTFARSGGCGGEGGGGGCRPGSSHGAASSGRRGGGGTSRGNSLLSLDMKAQKAATPNRSGASGDDIQQWVNTADKANFGIM